jgi:hypothetical protein
MPIQYDYDLEIKPLSWEWDPNWVIIIAVDDQTRTKKIRISVPRDSFTGFSELLKQINLNTFNNKNSHYKNNK